MLLSICKPQRIDIHEFCDASEVAYGACIYIRSIRDSDSNINVNLLCFKPRVALVKQISIPGVKVYGAVLLVRLLSQVTKFSLVGLYDCSGLAKGPQTIGKSL